MNQIKLDNSIYGTTRFYSLFFFKVFTCVLNIFIQEIYKAFTYRKNIIYTDGRIKCFVYIILVRIKVTHKIKAYSFILFISAGHLSTHIKLYLLTL